MKTTKSCAVGAACCCVTGRAEPKESQVLAFVASIVFVLMLQKAKARAVLVVHSTVSRKTVDGKPISNQAPFFYLLSQFSQFERQIHAQQPHTARHLGP